MPKPSHLARSSALVEPKLGPKVNPQGRAPSPTLSPTNPVPRGLLTLEKEGGCAGVRVCVHL